MAIDVSRHVATDPGTRRKWWQRTFITREAPLHPRGYIMTGVDCDALTTDHVLSGRQLGIPRDVSVILLTAELQTVRYIVGEPPTSNYGAPLAAGLSVSLTLTDPDMLHVIAGTAGAVLHIQCFRPGGI